MGVLFFHSGCAVDLFSPLYGPGAKSSEDKKDTGLLPPAVVAPSTVLEKYVPRPDGTECGKWAGDHHIPDIANVSVDDSWVTIKFKWNVDTANHPDGYVGFKPGMALEISLATFSEKAHTSKGANEQFVYTQRDTTSDPYRPYPSGFDVMAFNSTTDVLFEFSSTGNSNNQSIEVEGAYRDVFNWSNKVDYDFYKKALQENCPSIYGYLNEVELRTLHYATKNSVDNASQFAVGTSAPEKLKRGVWYTIRYRIERNPGTGVRGQYAWVHSAIVRDHNYGVQNCPPMIGELTPLIDDFFVYTRGCSRSWLKKLCVPTKTYWFKPGLDIGENPEGVTCTDEDDKDTLFAPNKKHILHGTNNYDCNSSRADSLDSQSCFYGIGSISAGRQCYEMKNSYACFSSTSMTTEHFPEKFLTKYIEFSSKLRGVVGEYALLGYPSSWVSEQGKNLVQYLENGSLGNGALFYNAGRHEVYVLYGLGWEAYYNMFNNFKGALGPPMSDTYVSSGGIHTIDFLYGSISWIIHEQYM
jgi:hypothetical protein